MDLQARINLPQKLLNGYDALKIIALITMIIDHVGLYFYPEHLWLRAIGRMAFALFLFLVGYSLQYRIKTDIIIGCLFLIAVDAWTAQPIFAINILGSIILTRLLMAWMQRRAWIQLPPWQLMMVMLIWYLPTLFVFEYGSAAMMFSLLGYYARNKILPRAEYISLAVFVFVFHAITQIWLFDFDIGSAILSVMVLTVTMGLILSFTPDPLAIKNAFIQRAGALLSRHTMLIYVLHIMLFQITETILHPGPTGHVFFSRV